MRLWAPLNLIFVAMNVTGFFALKSIGAGAIAWGGRGRTGMRGMLCGLDPVQRDIMFSPPLLMFDTEHRGAPMIDCSCRHVHGPQEPQQSSDDRRRLVFLRSSLRLAGRDGLVWTGEDWSEIGISLVWPMAGRCGCTGVDGLVWSGVLPA